MGDSPRLGAVLIACCCWMGWATTVATTPSQLLADWRASPALGIESVTPSLSWAVPPSQTSQSAARITVFALPSGRPVWDFTVNGSAQSVTYAGAALQSCTQYAWSVLTIDGGGSSSAWSDNATFVTGVHSQAWPGGVPIWTPNATAQFVYMRTELQPLPASPQLFSAYAFITANPQGSSPGEQENSKLLGAYKLYVNGAIVGIGPGRPGRCGPVCPVGGGKGPCTCTPEHVYDTYDVTAALAASSSSPVTLAIQAFNYPPGPPAHADSKVVLQVVLTFADGSVQLVGGTGTAWRVWAADAYMNATCCTAQQWFIAPRENFDAGAQILGWKRAGFNDSGWATPALAAPFSHPLIARPTLPLAVEVGVLPAIVERRGAGHYFVDFGVEFQGGVTVAFANVVSNGTAPTPPRVFARFGETLLPNGLDVKYEMSTGNSYWMEWDLNSSGGDVTVETHEYLEFRWVGWG